MENGSSENQLFIHSGVGVANYFVRDEGRFQVRSKNEIKEFETLVRAYLFYSLLNCEASIWDMTDGPILVESKAYITET